MGWGGTRYKGHQFSCAQKLVSVYSSHRSDARAAESGGLEGLYDTPAGLELVFESGDEANYIVVFYNRSHRHGHLGDMSPEQFKGAYKVRHGGVH